MLSPAFAFLVNHLLAQAGWAREKLQPHAGKVARLELLPARVQVKVGADGTLSEAGPDEVPATCIRLTPEVLTAVLARGEEGWRKAEVEGDTDFAHAISIVAANLRWNPEEDLARLFGDIAGNRFAQAGRTAAAWPGQAAASLSAGVAEYLTEESRMLVTPLDAAEFVREVDELRDAAERLEKRIAILERPPQDG
jgi:ubiquinone biosynthesis accessory factor UbiJ